MFPGGFAAGLSERGQTFESHRALDTQIKRFLTAAIHAMTRGSG